MYYYELHLHTKETSKCGKSPAADMVKAYIDKGFSGICVTDHFVNGYSYAADPIAWQDKIDAFMKGYNAAKAAAEGTDLQVFFGWEYTYGRNNAEDYVTLGLTESHLRHELVDCDQWELTDYIDTVHALGGIVIRAHPYRQAAYIPTEPIEHPGLNVDAIEVYNGGNEDDSYDEKALAFTIKEGKPQVAGSDTHHVTTTALGYIGLEKRPEDVRQLCEAIRSGRAVVIRKPKVFYH